MRSLAVALALTVCAPGCHRWFPERDFVHGELAPGHHEVRVKRALLVYDVGGPGHGPVCFSGARVAIPHVRWATVIYFADRRRRWRAVLMKYLRLREYLDCEDVEDPDAPPEPPEPEPPPEPPAPKYPPLPPDPG